MTAEHPGEAPRRIRGAPDVVAPTNRINVALPFSKIQTLEPSKELGELAEVVAGLAAILEEVAPGKESKKLHDHARRLAGQLQEG